MVKGERSLRLLETRWARKHPPGSAVGSTWWAPRARGWWIGALFGVGSLLFALGAIPVYSISFGDRVTSATFFVGSIFFTVAAFLQYREVVDSIPVGSRRRRKFFVFWPRRIEWLASAIQLAGTLLFNRSTGNACRIDLTAQAAHQTVWRPDAVGSACFLLASLLAWWEVCHGWGHWRPGQIDWWITLVNLAGSVAFGVSAVAGYIVPGTGQIRNAALSNLGTLVGAVGFLVGAILLLIERTEPVAQPVAPIRPSQA
jgi:hypothetical protein